MRRSTGWLLVAAAVAAFAGCKDFQKDALPLELARDCGDMDLNGARAVSRLGELAEDKDLHCALDYLRNRVAQGVPEAVTAARLAFLIADRNTDSVRVEKLASEGMRWAQYALELSADVFPDFAAAAHYYLAVNLGLAVQDTVMLALKNIDRIKFELEAARRIDPDFDKGGPSRVLGLLYVKAPSWPKGFGDPDKGLELLADAVRRFPNYPPNRILYARGLTDVDAEEHRDEIREQIDAARRLLEAGTWGAPQARWSRDLDQVARDAGVGGGQATVEAR